MRTVLDPSSLELPGQAGVKSVWTGLGLRGVSGWRWKPTSRREARIHGFMGRDRPGCALSSMMAGYPHLTFGYSPGQENEGMAGFRKRRSYSASEISGASRT